MPNENTTADGKDSAQLEDESALRGADCSPSLWRCENCIHWQRENSSYGNCTNNAKIHEDDYRKVTETDHLIYCYYESGGFSTGKDFGCIHFSQTNAIAQTPPDSGTKNL